MTVATEPLWWREIEARQLAAERAAEAERERRAYEALCDAYVPRPPHRPGTRKGAPRRHPAAAVGDRFGCWRVTRLLARDARADERVLVVCERCGLERAQYVFNIRRGEPRCGRSHLA